MDSRQQAQTSMMKRVKTKVNATDAATRNAMLHFNDAYSEFLIRQAKISDCFDLQIEDRKGWRKTKEIIRNTLIQNIIDYGAMTESYADFINDEVLLNKVNFTPSELEKLTEQEFIAITNVMAQVLHIYRAALLPYGLSDEMFLSFIELKDRFVTITPLPKTGIDKRKIATSEIIVLITEALRYLQTMDRAVRAYRLTNPSFHNEYFTAREVENPQHRNLAASGTLVNADGAVIPFVKMSCPTLDIKRKLGENGNFRIRGAVNGPHLITFKQPNFKTIVKEVIFVTGQHLQIDIIMEPR